MMRRVRSSNNRQTAANFFGNAALDSITRDHNKFNHMLIPLFLYAALTPPRSRWAAP
jgi:hypothetical protein